MLFDGRILEDARESQEPRKYGRVIQIKIWSIREIESAGGVSKIKPLEIDFWETLQKSGRVAPKLASRNSSYLRSPPGFYGSKLKMVGENATPNSLLSGVRITVVYADFKVCFAFAQDFAATAWRAPEEFWKMPEGWRSGSGP